MDVKTIILGFLSYTEMSGYDIKQAFSNSIGFFYDASFGAIYPALRKLEDEGYVTKREVIQSGKPNKILYSITEAGREAFRKEMLTPILPPVLRSDMLVKIFFGKSRTPEEQRELMQDCLEMQRDLLKHTRHSYQDLQQHLDEYQRFCWEYTIHHLETTIAFLEQHMPALLKQQTACPL
ncbi:MULTISPECIES: PadR family transcriptional regulator [Bacillales]|jgi:DNA-binding PadR family transcriptional regulator|uniref:PadR family transcriptional regulator n=1 Tax=Brevibacillus aydinogluensis TaxID=927786 RepID=A0AA48M8R0_9BACL|nr:MULTISPECIES: helix-turn-helix transcriptional regulator [Bacillales]REK61269.1 MAG: PadR family transcriptional regulator [Brevibacillus sp.]MBR8660922.1 helix-turn-helix transcriptional regulator [Brevibacillus sp. NL20B1]MDT3416951.1 DNA-binding PadR family transcriptional regulator [Brevibacillus aydinogluensis]NNV04340.1 PadR family transcriptional regulator [Brevibacillus sp. MCWH]UFJ61431.1 helix-turn-helix transcriptional regulator [Anoxybacillus sediminis]